MGSFALPQQPATDAMSKQDKDVKLTDLERDFLGFLCYQWGHTYCEDTDEQAAWLEQLGGKLSA